MSARLTILSPEVSSDFGSAVRFVVVVVVVGDLLSFECLFLSGGVVCEALLCVLVAAGFMREFSSLPTCLSILFPLCFFPCLLFI